MKEIIYYLLKSGLWLSVFWLIYYLFLRKETFYTFNRYFLLGGMILSFILPFCRYNYQLEIVVSSLAGNSNYSAAGEPSSAVNIEFSHVLLLVYFVVCCVVTIYYLHNIIKINHWIRFQRNIYGSDAKIFRSSPVGSSFSFINYIFINAKPTLSSVEENLILTHEKAHVEQFHWLDLFVVQLVSIVQWFNPFIWLYRKAIRQNHEYLADKTVMQRISTPAIYYATLINNTLNVPVFAFANSFSYDTKFSRIHMMKKNASSKWKKAPVFFIVPLFACFLWAFAEPEYVFIQSEDPTISFFQDTLGLDGDNLQVTGVIASVKTKGDSLSIVGEKAVKKEIKLMINNPSISNADQDSSKMKAYIARIDGLTNNDDPIRLNMKKIGNPKDSVSKTVRVFHYNPKKADEPLIIIDGEEADIKLDKINDIDVSEIYSITVLKDQSAISTYGERAKNGVIEITTKKNKFLSYPSLISPDSHIQ